MAGKRRPRQSSALSYRALPFLTASRATMAANCLQHANWRPANRPTWPKRESPLPDTLKPLPRPEAKPSATETQFQFQFAAKQTCRKPTGLTKRQTGSEPVAYLRLTDEDTVLPAPSTHSKGHAVLFCQVLLLPLRTSYFRVPDLLAHEMNMDLLLITDDSHRMSRNKMNNNKQPFLGFLFLWSYLARKKACTGCTMRKALLPLRAASTSHKKIKLVPKATPERVRQQGFIIRSTWFFILSESYILVYVWEVVSPFYRSSMLLLSY